MLRQGLDESCKRNIFMKWREDVEVQDDKFGKGQEDPDHDRMMREILSKKAEEKKKNDKKRKASNTKGKFFLSR